MKLPALLIALVSASATLAGLVLIARIPEDAIPGGYRLGEMLPFVILQLGYTVVGALLVWRRPYNRIGWLLSGTALAVAALTLLSGLFAHAISTGATGLAAVSAWLSSLIVLAGLGATQGPAMLMFPDGRLPSRAARVALGLFAITLALCSIAIAFRPGPFATFPGTVNPFGWRDHSGALDAAFAIGLLIGLISGLLAIWSQIQRFRRASGAERQQLKWFLAGTVFLFVTVIPVVGLMYGPELDPGAASTQRYAGRATGALMSLAIPVTIGIAILRYRLYDIDLLIRRTLVYGAVSAALVATYFGSVALFLALIRPFTSGSALAVAGSTLLIVALFQPLRRRIQDIVDRRFYRSRYDAARTLDAFSARLRNEVELEAVRADLLGAVAETVQPAHASVWLRGSR